MIYENNPKTTEIIEEFISINGKIVEKLVNLHNDNVINQFYRENFFNIIQTNSTLRQLQEIARVLENPNFQRILLQFKNRLDGGLTVEDFVNQNQVDEEYHKLKKFEDPLSDIKLIVIANNSSSKLKEMIGEDANTILLGRKRAAKLLPIFHITKVKENSTPVNKESPKSESKVKNLDLFQDIYGFSNNLEDENTNFCSQTSNQSDSNYIDLKLENLGYLNLREFEISEQSNEFK